MARTDDRRTAPHTSDPQGTKALGLEAVSRGRDAGEHSFHEMFAKAARCRSRLRFLRLGGPHQFRSEVIAVVTEKLAMTAALKFLLDPRIPAIEFVLANPFSEAFLARLDAEGKDNREIWRIRSEVLEFSLGLLHASAIRTRSGQNGLVIAFHAKDLLWNLSITGEERVVARAYYKASTGHDAGVADIHVRSGSEARLAESFIAYYESVKNDLSTRFLCRENDVTSLGEWPSLFKGNAVWREQEGDGAGSWVKVVSSAEGRDAEAAWLGSRGQEAQHCTHFKPIGFERRRVEADTCFGGHGLRLRHTEGMTAERLAFEVQRLARERPALRDRLRVLISAVVGQALQALREFRQVRAAFVRAGPLSPGERAYPWPQKLERALTEAGRFVTKDGALLAAARAEALRLAEQLQEQAACPFRDAHLKNRLVAIDPRWVEDDWRLFGAWLETADDGVIDRWLRANTHDIDFETGNLLVTEWDDPLHVLCSPNLGFEGPQMGADGFPLLAQWWDRPKDARQQRSLQETLLCRSLRELCRRVWYANVMPNTYQQRYQTEKPYHFLGLARTAASQLQYCTAIEEFLSECWKQRASIWQLAPLADWEEPAPADRPLYTPPSPGGEKVPRAGAPGLLLAGSAGPSAGDGPGPKNDGGERVRILFMAANPVAGSHLGLDREFREIQEKIWSTPQRDRLELVWSGATRPGDLHQYLLRNEPHVVHFSGHGSPASELLLHHDDKQLQPVTTEWLRDLFLHLKDKVRIVLLNACFTEPQARAITEVIDCAVGMSAPIGDRAAILFAATFYQTIGFGRSVQTAFNLGVHALQGSGIPHGAIPRLLVREGVDPSQVVLVPAPESPP
jgi:hypothetical protein